MVNWNTQTVFVTGRSKFIGTFLTEELVGRDTDIVVGDNFSKGHEKIEHLVAMAEGLERIYKWAESELGEQAQWAWMTEVPTNE